MVDSQEQNDDLSWREFIKSRVLPTLTKSSVFERLEFLQVLLARLEKRDFPPDALPLLLHSVFLTYPRYHDRESRSAILRVLQELNQTDAAAFQKAFVPMVVNEAEKSGKRASGGNCVTPDSERFALLIWVNFLVVSTLGADSSSALLTPLVNAQALLLDSIACQSRSSITQSAFRDVRRTIRKTASHIPQLIDVALSNAKTCTPSYSKAVLLGTIVDTSLQLKLKSLDGKGMVKQAAPKLNEYYLQNVISSKTPVSKPAKVAFKDFVNFSVTKDVFEKDYLPVIQSAVAKTPEATLNVLSSLTSFLSFDPASFFANSLLEPVLKAFYSPLAIREGAFTLWSAMTEVCREQEALIKITSEATSLLKSGKVSAFESRVLLYKALSLLSRCEDTAVCQLAIEGLLAMTTKETNNQAMSTLISSIGAHMTVLLHNDDFCTAHKEVINSAVKISYDGLATTKVQVRQSWALAFGSMIWARKESSATLSAHVDKYLQAMFVTFDKIVEKPAMWKDGPLEAYVLIASLSGRILQWPDLPETVPRLLKNHSYPASMLINTPKPSILLWPRIYTKAVSTEEGEWFVKALTSFFAQESLSSLDTSGAGNLCAQAIIWLITNHPEHTVRQKAFEETASLAARDSSKLCRFVVPELKKWLLDIENGAKDSIAMSNRVVENFNKDLAAYRLASVLNAITSFDPAASAKEKEERLLELILLAHHQYIASPTEKYNWITLAQRARVDPGNLVNNHRENILNTLKQTFAAKKESTLFFNAACSVISTVVFIEPDFVSILADFTGRLLDDERLSAVDDFHYNVWNTPEGTTYVDVLSKKKGNVSRGNMTKDELWEEEMRLEMAKKNKAPPKLTKEEQTAVASQKAEEGRIRSKVQSIRDDLALGLCVIDAMIVGNSQKVKSIIDRLITRLLKVAKHGAIRLVGQPVVDSYLGLGTCLSDDLPSIHNAIGLAGLRINNTPDIPSQWTQEPLYDLIDRVLHRLRFVTESRPLQPESFVYCFPVLYQVINGDDLPLGREKISLDQVTMAMDVIGYHCSEASATVMPRKDMIQSILHVIREHPSISKNAKSSLVELCKSLDSSDMSTDINALFTGLLSEESQVRHAALEGLEHVDLVDIDYSSELLLACHDENKTNAEIANRIWEINGLDVDEKYKDQLLEYAMSDSDYQQVAAGGAIADAIKLYPDTVIDVVSTIYALYKEKALSAQPKLDRFGEEIPELRIPTDRIGIARVLKAIAALIPPSKINEFCSFLIQQEALGDRNGQVRKEMLETGLAAVNAHGKENVQEFLSIFESYLNTRPSGSEKHDAIRQAVVILYGAAAGFLESGDSKVRTAVDKLIETLDTPSEVVQSAVAECLPTLIKMIKDDVPAICKQLIEKLLKSEKYAQRRGAAYGLAGVVKGRGIIALKECGIINTLEDAISKKEYQCRQGALFAFETMTVMLGRLFEPYIMKIIPLLLECSGDAKEDVREACSDTARIIMSKISGHCVKLILPSLLGGLDDRQWRTKKASVELLGATAYCAPKQLSLSLPTIIPRITEVLADTHPKVQAAAKHSLGVFGKVISNPEIQELVPVLLAALSDPSKKSKAALDALLKTSFAHYIDPPSLALVMPILDRGLREKETKVKAAQIMGNMTSLTEQKDLVSYLPVLLPKLKGVLADPSPAARGTAAKSLGSLMEALGEENIPSLVGELHETLSSGSGGIDQQGAAQGLAEVLAALGLERLESVLPDIIKNIDNPNAYVREAYIYLLVYLPATFGARLQPYLDRIITPILSGLADESEAVREASLRAGNKIVNEYATKAVKLLLPELEKGLMDANWRIRQSSVQLVGSLLFRVTGSSNQSMASKALGNMDIATENDNNNGDAADTQKKKLVDILGKERNDQILASLYVVRHDMSGLVRNESLTVWKEFVSNTVRMLKDILPVIMRLILKNLASESDEQQGVATRTLNDLVLKLGETKLKDILSSLEQGAALEDDASRRGVTVALSEIMVSADVTNVEDHASQITAIINKALSDTSAEVREAGAQAFDTFHQCVGSKAIRSVVPALLQQLQSSDDSSARALSALQDIMEVPAADAVFPALIPTLIQVPISASNAMALSSLVKMAGPALNRRLRAILRALIDTRINEPDEETLTQLSGATEALLESVEEDGLETLMNTLLEGVKSHKAAERCVVSDIIATFYTVNGLSVNEYEYERVWINRMVLLLEDRDATVVQSAWSALSAVTASVPKEDYTDELITETYNAVRRVGVAGVDLAGFCLPKGISPVLPVFLQGLMKGTTGTRKRSAKGIGCLVDRTSTEALKPFVTQITGSLIRVAAENHPAQVKAAILETMYLLLCKAPAFLKPFLPQLQRTLTKSLVDTSSHEVREQAAAALQILISLQPRVDPLIKELTTTLSSCEEEIKETILQVLEKAAETETIKTSMVSVIASGLDDATMRPGAELLLKRLAKQSDLTDAPGVIQNYLASHH